MTRSTMSAVAQVRRNLEAAGLAVETIEVVNDAPMLQRPPKGRTSWPPFGVVKDEPPHSPSSAVSATPPAVPVPEIEVPLVEIEIEPEPEEAPQPTDASPRAVVGINYPPTDAGNAEAFAHAEGQRVRFEVRSRDFFLFSSHHWRKDETEEIRRLVVEHLRARATAELAAGKNVKVVQQTLQRCESTRDISNLLNETHHLLAMFRERCDVDPFRIGVLNGTVDLHTGQLHPGRPDDFITRIAPVTYELRAIGLVDTAKSPCPVWDRTLAQVFPDADVRSCFERALGYSMTGDCSEESWFLCHGLGANGKGLTMNTVAAVLGPDYADNLAVRSLIQRTHGDDDIPVDLAKLVGKRFVTASEPNSRVRLNEARLKTLSGRDPITARHFRQEEFTFQPTFKLWLATNSKPAIADTSDGFWRRVVFFPFEQTFKDHPDVTLKDRLLIERDGIFARLVRGCLAWQRDRLSPPSSMTEAVGAYRDESRPLADFVRDRCEVGAGEAQAAALYADYVAWAGKDYALSQKRFGALLRDQFHAVERRRVVFYQGLRLREDATA